MESLPLLIVFAIVYVPTLCALIWVLLFAMKQTREAATANLRLSEENRTFLTSLLGSSRQESRELLEQATRSHSSALDSLTSLLTHQTTLLASKDPLAYQMVTASHESAIAAERSPDGEAMYSSADEGYLERLQQMQALIERAGVAPDVDYFTPTGTAE